MRGYSFKLTPAFIRPLTTLYVQDIAKDPGKNTKLGADFSEGSAPPFAFAPPQLCELESAFKVIVVEGKASSEDQVRAAKKKIRPQGDGPPDSSGVGWPASPVPQWVDLAFHLNLPRQWNKTQRSVGGRGEGGGKQTRLL